MGQMITVSLSSVFFDFIVGVEMVKTMDGTLAYFVSQLEALDSKLYEPLYNTSWARDIKLRSGVTFGHDSTAFTRIEWGAAGTQKANGMPFISANATTLEGVSVDGERVVLPMRLLGRELSYSSVELERSQLLGNSIDTQKFNALNVSYQLATDKMVYVGCDEVTTNGQKVTGLLNNKDVTVGNVIKTWATATVDEILADVNSALERAWQASGYSVCPNKLLLPPAQFALLAGKRIGDSGDTSVLKFLKDNTIALSINGSALDIQPVKWLAGIGGSTDNGKDRMVVYTNDEDKVRFPLVPIRRETPYYHGINFIAPYIWAFGEVEFVYPETVYYADGI